LILLLKDLTDPGAGRFPQKTLSIPAGQQLVLSCMAQCRNDTGLQPSFRNQHIAMQTVDHIREQTPITQWAWLNSRSTTTAPIVFVNDTRHSP
jgi:hypothetical protein